MQKMTKMADSVNKSKLSVKETNWALHWEDGWYENRISCVFAALNIREQSMAKASQQRNIIRRAEADGASRATSSA